MKKAFNCVACGKKVVVDRANPACRHTCGDAKCQAVYQKQYSAQMDRYRQRDRIEQLQQQGIDLVTCVVCDRQFEMIGQSHLKTHGLTVDEYKTLYPDSPRCNSRIVQQRGRESLKRSHYLEYVGKAPDQELYQFLTGSLLGDASLEKRPNKLNARYAEGAANQKYLEWKYKFISQYFSCTFNERLSSPHTKTGKQYQGWWLKSTVHPVLTEIHSQWYQPKKIISESFLSEYLTEFALTIWFCDDGCSTGGVRFYPMAFSDDEVQFIVSLLESRFNLHGSILRNQKNQHFINLDANSRKIFREIVSKFSIPGMEYKLNF